MSRLLNFQSNRKPQCKDTIQGTLFLHTCHCMAYSQHSMCTLTYHYKEPVYAAGKKHRDHKIMQSNNKACPLGLCRGDRSARDSGNSDGPAFSPPVYPWPSTNENQIPKPLLKLRNDAEAVRRKVSMCS